MYIGNMPKGPKLTPEVKVVVAGLLDAGKTPKQIQEITGLSGQSVWRIKKEAAPLNEEDLKVVKDRLRGRFLIATDTLLESALKDAEQETPYKRMIMAGIAHDHYLRTLMFERGANSAGVLAQIIVMVDASNRGLPNPFDDPSKTIDAEAA